MTVFSM